MNEEVECGLKNIDSVAEVVIGYKGVISCPSCDEE